MAFELDQNFGNSGIVGNDNYISTIFSTHIQNGKILSAGYYYNQADGYDYLFIVRYNSAGIIDTTFGTNGYILAEYNVNTSYYSKIMVVLSNNKFIVLCKNPNNNNFAFIRYTEDGIIDTSFGTDGFLNTGYSFHSGDFCSIVKDRNDGIIFTFIDSNTYKYRRYNSNGTTNGNLTSTIFTRYNACSCNTVDSNGNIIFAGRENGVGTGVANPLLYAVYDITDSLNTSIGESGYVYYRHSHTTGNQGYTSVITDTNNNIILVADYGTTSLVHKYDTNGNLLYYNRNINANGLFTSLNILSDKILVGLQKDNNNDNEEELYYLTRLNSNLTVDTSFGTNGYIITSLTNTVSITSRILNIVIYSSSKIIVSGFIIDNDTVIEEDIDIARFRILCFSSDNLDPVFADLLTNISNNENVLEFNVEEFGKNNSTVSSVMGNLINSMLNNI